VFNTSTKIAIAFVILLAAPTASFARMAGEAGTGNVPISGIAPGPANARGLNNVMVDPSGIANASKVAPLPQPRITVPVVPQFK
jgi:hypothetical protein